MKISAVIIGRNDNYGGNLNERATYCLNTMCEVFDEVVYIDWNSNNIPLNQEVKITNKNLVPITVTKEMVKYILKDNYNSAQPCCEVLARNIGIRRATGDIIVSTNIDIIPDIKENLINTFSTIQSNEFCVVRRKNIDRLELDNIFKSLNYNYNDLIINMNKVSYLQEPFHEDKRILINCCGDFQVARKETWYKLKGFNEKMFKRMFADGEIQIRATLNDIKLRALEDLSIYHINHYRNHYHNSNDWNDMINTSKNVNDNNWGASNFIPLNEHVYNDNFIITTTINSPTKALYKFLDKKNWNIIVVGDLKTPHFKYIELSEKYKNLIYLHPDYQEIKYNELSKYIGWNTIQRRNIGFIDAYNRGANIMATVDDDNIPYDNWGNDLLINKEVEVSVFKSKCNVFDILSATENKHLWHRGFPVELLSERESKIIKTDKIKCLIQIDLWDGDPDIDAICRISNSNPKVKFDNIQPFTSPDIMPFNSQNTFISRELIPLYCVFPKIGRMDDIWGAYYLQSKFKQKSPYIVINKSSVYQDRIEHSFNGKIHTSVDDLEREIIGYRNNMNIINDLLSNKSNSTQNSLISQMDEFMNIYSKYFQK